MVANLAVAHIGIMLVFVFARGDALCFICDSDSHLIGNRTYGHILSNGRLYIGICIIGRMG